MRTNIEIDDDLMARAVELSGLKTKRATVEQGLRLLIKLKQQEHVGDLFGKVSWQGDLDQSRRGRLVR
jgi:Arc/MetJ family transcription regulator